MYTKQFKELSEFKQRDVELFRSLNQFETAIYFTDIKDDEEGVAKAFFEILRFGVDGGDHQIYIRFPNTDHFIEMIEGGFGNSRGDMKIGVGRNVWETFKCSKPFTIYSDKDNLLFLKHNSSELNFMTKVASYNKGNPFDHPYPNETFFNYEEIEKALSLKYLKLPDTRSIVYCYKTNTETPKYFIVDCPAYKFRYDQFKFFVVENNSVKEYEIDKFTRYRDGGTTIITVIDENGKMNKFFVPTPMSAKNLCKTWNDDMLIEVTNEEKSKLIELLSSTLGIEYDLGDEE